MQDITAVFEAGLPLRPAAVLFDLDGTLVDSERDAADALDEVLSGLGRPLTQEERMFVIGHAWGEIYHHLTGNRPVSMPLPVLEEAIFQVRLKRARAQGITELPGAREAVRRTARRCPCALVTGSSRSEAELMIECLGLGPCFRTLVCAGEYERGKPAPDPYLRGASLLAVPPAACLVVEDSRAGIASARAAGMFCIALRAGNFAAQDQSGAHLVLDTLAQVDALLDSVYTS